MASVAGNEAAWQKQALAKAFTVGPGPDHSKPADDEVVIKVHATAINPADWKIPEAPFKEYDYPWIFGSDAAGEVVLVGSKVTKFKPGDRVIGHFLGLIFGTAKHGSFQKYATTRQQVVAKLPDNIDFAHGAVLPLALSTSSVALFDMLKLQLPSLKPVDQAAIVLIWGAGSSIASVGIQLARAAGYEVITTASAKNHEYAKALGASQVFDYNKPEAVEEIKTYLKGKKLAGVFDCIGEQATISCAEILSASGGGKLPTTLWPTQTFPDNVEASLVFATNPGTVDDYPNISIWQDFVPSALAAGVLVPKPEPLLLKGGVAKIEEAVKLQKKGVSAQKIVVEVVES